MVGWHIVGLTLVGLLVGELAWWAARGLAPEGEQRPPSQQHAWATRLLSATLFGLAGWRFGGDSRLWFVLPYSVVLLIILVMDLQHRLIVDKVTFPAMAVVLVASPFWPGLGLPSALLGGLFALVIFGVLLAIAWRIHPDALGMGDLKLAVLIGLASGFPLVLRALLAGFLAGGIIALALLALRLKSMKDTMPYGPGLVAGAFYALFVLSTPGA